MLQLLARGEIRSIAAQLPIAGDPDLGAFVAHDEAVRAVRALKQGSTVGVAGALGLGRELFAQGVRAERSTTLPLIVSTSLHGLAVATILFVASLGFAVADERTEPLKEPEPIRMVFLVSPGPGGGGGGGGMKMKTPPPRAERKGVEKISSPLPARKLPPPMRPEPKPPEPPKPLEAKQLPPVMAPIPTKQAETAGSRRRAGEGARDGAEPGLRHRRRRRGPDKARALVPATAAASAMDPAAATAADRSVPAAASNRRGCCAK